MPISNYEIGTAYGNMTNLEQLTVPVPPPKSTYRPYAEMKKLVSGIVRGVGFPVATWKWGVISQAARDQLREFCSGQSAVVYIRTRTMDTIEIEESSTDYKVFQAVMVWPTQEEERDAGRRLDFKIEFQSMVEITEEGD